MVSCCALFDRIWVDRLWFAANIMKTSLDFFLLLLCAVMGADACADTALGRDWAGACSGCHGTEGRSEGAIPPLAGMHKDNFVQLMKAFRDGTLPATVMHQHARGLTDEQIGAIGDYFASRSPR
jgi:cytochrome c553